MKIVTTWAALALFAVWQWAAPVEAESTGTLTVKVSGLRNSQGVVRIAVFNSEADYQSDKFSAEKAFKKAIAPVKDNQAAYTFDALPYGQYAVKLFHDEDNSGKFLTNFLGIPKVEYGFSNNPWAKLGAPGYDKARFDFQAGELTLDIKAQHP